LLELLFKVSDGVAQAIGELREDFIAELWGLDCGSLPGIFFEGLMDFKNKATGGGMERGRVLEVFCVQAVGVRTDVTSNLERGNRHVCERQASWGGLSVENMCVGGAVYSWSSMDGT